MNKYFEAVNSILAKWDPIGVGNSIANHEYSGYVPSILKSIDDKQELRYCLENILMNQIGTGYNPRNKRHLEDLLSVCDQIIEAIRNLEEGK